MKVAFLNRNPTTHAGGDLIMLDAMMQALCKQGVQCTNVYGDWTPQTLQPYDLVHIQHLNFTWSRYNLEHTAQSGKPFVIVPIFYPTPLLGLDYRQMREWMQRARAVVPLSFAEARDIATLTNYLGPFDVIPHGTDEAFHQPEGGERVGVVACNARGDKGEQLVEKACKELGLPFTYLRGIPHDQLPAHFARAKVFVHSSLDDRMSLTVGEALCAGCRVISSCWDRGNEWFPELKVCDPTSEVTLTHAILMAYDYTEWDYTPNRAARELTWELAAWRLKQVYERVLRRDQ